MRNSCLISTLSRLKKGQNTSNFATLLEKRAKNVKFRNFGTNGLQNFFFDTQKLLSGTWNFFWASTTVSKRNFGPWFIHPCHNMAMSQAKRWFSMSFFFSFFEFRKQFLVLRVLRFWWNFAWKYSIMSSISSKNLVQISEL